MNTPLRMLVARDGWNRVAEQVAARELAIHPIVVERDGSYTSSDQPIDIGNADIDAAWYSPDLFLLDQDQQFLRELLSHDNVKWMHSSRAGYDDPAFAALSARGVRLSSCKATAPAIAEFVIATVFDHFQGGPARRAFQAEQRWRPEFFREIAGSCWLCIGYGAIGREIAVRARALGAHVTGVRRSGGSDPDVDAIVTPEAMAETLAGADVVILSVPLAADNDGFYDAAFFAGMKRGALFVNIGRGQLIDDDALREALDTGQIAHAALDVARIEPLPSDAWQWRHPRITMTAHVAGRGSGLNRRVDAAMLDNLERYLKGDALRNEIEPDVFR